MFCASSVRILLANLLQSSMSTFSWRSFLSFFAFKAGMLDTQISALGGWPTVSPRLLRRENRWNAAGAGLPDAAWIDCTRTAARGFVLRCDCHLWVYAHQLGKTLSRRETNPGESNTLSVLPPA